MTITDRIFCGTRLGAATTPDGAITVHTVEEAFGVREHHMMQVLQTQDRLVREQLIKIGWTPPTPEAEAAYLASLKSKPQ